jgi:hypothetical protein
VASSAEAVVGSGVDPGVDVTALAGASDNAKIDPAQINPGRESRIGCSIELTYSAAVVEIVNPTGLRDGRNLFSRMAVSDHPVCPFFRVNPR